MLKRGKKGESRREKSRKREGWEEGKQRRERVRESGRGLAKRSIGGREGEAAGGEKVRGQRGREERQKRREQTNRKND